VVRVPLLLFPAAILLALTLGCVGQDSGIEGGEMSISITSTAFRHDGAIPVKYTCDGDNVSPPLSWGEMPGNTRSIALVCDDPDSPRKFAHWLLYNIPPDVTTLQEGIPTGELVEGRAMQGTNDFGDVGYGGPCPPDGSAHHYHFTLYALDTVVDLEAGASKGQLHDAMGGHVLGQGRLVGTYER